MSTATCPPACTHTLWVAMLQQSPSLAAFFSWAGFAHAVFIFIIGWGDRCVLHCTVQGEAAERHNLEEIVVKGLILLRNPCTGNLGPATKPGWNLGNGVNVQTHLQHLCLYACDATSVASSEMENMAIVGQITVQNRVLAVGLGRWAAPSELRLFFETKEKPSQVCFLLKNYGRSSMQFPKINNRGNLSINLIGENFYYTWRWNLDSLDVEDKDPWL